MLALPMRLLALAAALLLAPLATAQDAPEHNTPEAPRDTVFTARISARSSVRGGWNAAGTGTRWRRRIVLTWKRSEIATSSEP